MSVPPAATDDNLSVGISRGWLPGWAPTRFGSAAILSRIGRTALRCGISLLWLAIPAAVTAVLAPYHRFNPVISVSYVLAVSVAAWWGGVIAGFLVSCATIPVLTLVATKGLAVLPSHLDPVGLAALFFISFLVSSVAGNRKRVEQVLRAANEHLEGRVRERTAELRQANTAIEHRLAELESLYGELPVGLCFLDTDLRFVRVNERLAAINGIPARAHIGRELNALLPAALAGVVEPLYRQVLATGEPLIGFEMSDPTMAASPEQRSWMLTIAPVDTESGAIIGAQCVVQDITERKRSERALREANENLRRANGDLQQFAFSASHDLQEPLRTVSIYSQLLGRRYGAQFDATGLTFLEYLTTAAKRMAMLVQDLLAYTRAAEEGEPGRETTDAGEALQFALQGLSAAVNENAAEIAHDALPAVKMRGVHLQQIFQNLVGNAIKYRSAEPPRIYVSCQQRDDMWVFSVRDNGIGIDPAYKERIFGIFKRLHTADRYSGTGIGLAICKRIVERYGGGIRVESEAGKGAAFFFSIPV
ncbi:MAG: sensor histidine kinase [Bryobacteraceae bacterium]